ncbi:MAG: DUF3592 domain-containing protein [Planctomycetia bacterium]|nr:DUF3592 domain-containing protein [Planctomycetia bacterium]
MPETNADNRRQGRRRFAVLTRWRQSESLTFGGVAAIGLVILVIHLSTWGVQTRRDAKLLTPTTCQVEKRQARARRDENGALYYRPEITILYSVNGQSYATTTYDRQTLSDDGGYVYDYPTVLKLLQPYPTGSTTRCWVRADDPTQAVLVRNASWQGWLFLTIPAMLIGFGGYLCLESIARRVFSKEARANARRTATVYPTVPTTTDTRGVVYEKRLASDAKSRVAFGAATVGAVLWNLASWGGFIFVASRSHTTMDAWLAAGFCVIFCGAGLLFACRQYGQYRIERAVGSMALEASHSTVTPGRKIKLCLILKGRIKVKRLDVYLRCEEVARFLQGTNSIVHRHEAYSRKVHTIYDVDVDAKAQQQEKFIAMAPVGAAPSFRAEHNEIMWNFTVVMEFNDGSTYSRDFEFVMLPFVPRDH